VLFLEAFTTPLMRQQLEAAQPAEMPSQSQIFISLRLFQLTINNTRQIGIWIISRNAG
jgi:hypothetical protein